MTQWLEVHMGSPSAAATRREVFISKVKQEAEE